MNKRSFGILAKQVLWTALRLMMVLFFVASSLSIPTLSAGAFVDENALKLNPTGNNLSGEMAAVAASTVTIAGSVGVSGVTLSYIDGTSKSVSSNRTGGYSITVSYNWTGTVTPQKKGYVFTPVSRAYTNLQTNQTAQNYSATLTPYAISGNAGVAGAMLNYTDGIARTAKADSTGNYSFSVSNNWTGTVTPSLPGYTFTPAYRSYSKVRANQKTQNYTAAAITYTISGNAGIPGATLRYTDGTAKTATADNMGAYAFTVSYNWSGTVTPVMAGYAFTPANRTYVHVLASQTSQNYAVSAIIYSISGNAGTPGATLSYTDGTPKTALADNTGAYSFAVSYDWSGVVTPTKAGYTFSPLNRSYSHVLSDQPVQNYSAAAITFTISGNAGVPGAALSYTDGTAKQALADGSGAYTFTVSYGWSGDVTPSLAGYTFSPVQRSYTNLLANLTAQDFTAAGITLTISGNVGLANASLYYTDGTAKTALADEAGAYSFTVPYGWIGAVTPAQTSYTFTPANRDYTQVTIDQNSQDYTAQHVPNLLSVIKVGTGSGSVTSSPEGIDCGSNCSYRFAHNSTVTLTAHPSAGSSFTGWEGACSGTGFCSVTLDQAKSITATFTLIEYRLNLTSLHGTLTRYPDKASYHYGDMVQLTALPEAGWTFEDWSGDLTGTAIPAVIPMNGDQSITANYTQIEYTLDLTSLHGNITRIPDQATYHFGDQVQLTAAANAGWSFMNWGGDGAGTDNPASIHIDGNKSVTANYSLNNYTLTITSLNGTVSKDPDQATYHYGDSVQLTAAPEMGWSFVNWSGDEVGSTNSIQITIHDNTSITANYAQNDYTLTIVSPHGSVAVSPDKFTYHYGDAVQLTSAPDLGWSFDVWSGDESGETNPFEITITGDTAIEANYVQTEYTLTVTSQHGSVDITPEQTSYHYGDTVQVAVTPDAGWLFGNWVGDTSSISNPLQLTVQGNTTITATYIKNEADLNVTHGSIPAAVNVGQAWSYTLTVSNAGPLDATNVLLTVPISTKLQFVSALAAGWTCNFTAGSLQCTLPKLNAGSYSTVTVNVKAQNTLGMVNDAAAVSSDVTDSILTDNTVNISTVIVNIPVTGTMYIYIPTVKK
jgi:uncharacterized repeat protein (TIGR01451 family)